jgi:hypothetical protein
VDPDALVELRIANTETLPDTISIGFVGDCTKQPIGRQWNLQQVDKAVIEKAHAMRPA